MHILRLIIATSGLLAMLACSQDSNVEQARGSATAQQRDDVQVPEVLPIRPIPLAEQDIEIDVDGRRVRMPGQDWITVAKFWDIYTNHPTQLIGTPDHAVLAQIPPIAGESMELAVQFVEAEEVKPMLMAEVPPENLGVVEEPETLYVPAEPEIFADSAPSLVSRE